MALRIFYIVLAVIVAFLSYDIYRLYGAYGQLGDAPSGYSIGPDNADLVVVEFLDYSCPFCQKIHPTIMQAVQQDGRVRYVPRPLSSKNRDAFASAMLAYSAGEQGKFAAMHEQLITGLRKINQESIAELSNAIGADLEQLRKGLEKESVKKKVAENRRLFSKLGTNATPTFVIGSEIVYVPKGRMPEVADFLEMFNEARSTP